MTHASPTVAEGDLDLRNLDADGRLRDANTGNKFGLTGFDHFAMPSLDIDRMYLFIRDVLGGEAFYIAGYDQADRDMGREKHIFMRVGTTLMQCATPGDGDLKVGTNDTNSWPHWAFTVRPEDLTRNCERLRALGIPVFGPVAHRGAGVTSAYFASPEGHKLELCTWEEFPAEETIGVMGAPDVGHIDWPSMFYEWPSKS